MDIALRAASGLLMIALPLATAAVLTRRWRIGWKVVLVGVATFIAAQVLHLPFNAYVLNPLLTAAGAGATPTAGAGLVLTAAALGLSAGVFEEAARWVSYRFWIRSARSWREGVLFGAGHGGAEAVLVGVAALATLIQLVALRGQELSAVVPAEQLDLARAQVEAYWALPGWATLFGLAERISAFVIQLSLSVLVLQAFVRPGRGLWLLAAIGWHALVDAVAVYVGVATGAQTGSPGAMALTEGLIAGLAVVSLVILLHLKTREPTPAVPPTSAPQRGPLPAAEPTQEMLESSRYRR